MKKAVRVIGSFALVPLLMAGLCAGYVWRNNRQHDNDKALLVAIDCNSTPAVIAALKRGANPDARELPYDSRSLRQRFLDLLRPTRPQNEKCKTAILLATYSKDEDDAPHTEPGTLAPAEPAIIQALLDAGANPNLPVVGSVSPLLAAEENHNYAVAHLLLEHHADIHARDAEGQTALILAAQAGNDAEVKFLLQHGADIEEEDNGGNCALIWTVLYGRDSVANYLIAQKANLNHKNKEGFTAFYFSHGHCQLTIEKLLIQAGAVE